MPLVKRMLLALVVGVLFLTGAGASSDVHAQTTYDAYVNFVTQPPGPGAVSQAGQTFQYGYTGQCVANTSGCLASPPNPGGGPAAGFTAYNSYVQTTGAGGGTVAGGPDQIYYSATPAGAPPGASPVSRTIREVGQDTNTPVPNFADGTDHELTIRPGTGSADAYNIVRFVAPVTGTYQVAGYFRVPTGSVNNVDVGIRLNGVVLSNVLLPVVLGPGFAIYQFNFTVPAVGFTPLGLGSLIDFYTGFFGTNPEGSIFDVAYLQATITVIPEPGTVLLIGISLIGLAAGAWRWRKSQRGEDDGLDGLAGA